MLLLWHVVLQHTSHVHRVPDTCHSVLRLLACVSRALVEHIGGRTMRMHCSVSASMRRNVSHVVHYNLLPKQSPASWRYSCSCSGSFQLLPYAFLYMPLTPKNSVTSLSLRIASQVKATNESARGNAMRSRTGWQSNRQF